MSHRACPVARRCREFHRAFGTGTFALAREVALLTRSGGLLSVAGGGDTVAALISAGPTSDFTYVSTASGAFLKWLVSRELPGVAALARGQDCDRHGSPCR